MAEGEHFIYWLEVAEIYFAFAAKNNTREAASGNIIYSTSSFHKSRLEKWNGTLHVAQMQ